MEKIPWKKPGSVRVPVFLWRNERTWCEYPSLYIPDRIARLKDSMKG